MTWEGRRVLIEVAVESVADARAAEAGGADRVELCAALDLGGLTPSLGAYLEVRAATRLPVVVMVRPRPGDFVADDDEVRVMARDIALFGPHAPAGFVFGCLAADGRVHGERNRRLVDAAAGVGCVFHRAFDRAPDPAEALDAAMHLGFKRVLTSGRADAAVHGAAAIAEVKRLAANRIEVLPCGRVRADTVAAVVRQTGCSQVHGSFAEPVVPPPGRGHRGYAGRSATSQEAVAATRAALTALSLGRG
jgi:copper homeostasis protein